MAKSLVLLPGWGLGPAALKTLRQVLQERLPSMSILIEPLPSADSVEQALDELNASLPPGAWLLGWSLGGMLAVALAARRGVNCPGMITLGSNPCFVARDHWPTAMPRAIFEGFSALCVTDRTATLKRFSLLCTQGSAEARALAKQLLPMSEQYADPASLALLGALDNRAALAELSVPQLHLFAQGDALVPEQTALALEEIAPQARVIRLAGSHALPIEAPTQVADRVTAFIEECNHG
jgi:pimeloyl-[acyl-carrier protein] methyl ester esterase